MKTWTVKPATARELADLYEVSYHVFKSHIQPFKSEIGPRVGHFYTVKQVIIIIDLLGPPPDTDVIYPGQQQ